MLGLSAIMGTGGGSGGSDGRTDKGRFHYGEGRIQRQAQAQAQAQEGEGYQAGRRWSIDMDFIIHPLCLLLQGGIRERERGTIVMRFPCLLPLFSFMLSHMFFCASWTYRTGYHGSGSGSGFWYWCAGAGIGLVWSGLLFLIKESERSENKTRSTARQRKSMAWQRGYSKRKVMAKQEGMFPLPYHKPVHHTQCRRVSEREKKTRNAR
jgi:hypothetical protein